MLCLNKNLLLSNPEKVVQLPNDKWNEYIPMRPTIEELDRENNEEDNDDDNVEDNDADDDDVEDNNAIINAAGGDVSTLSSSGSNKEDSLAMFDAEEYDSIVAETQQTVTETQAFTHRVFDSQDAMVPGSLH